MTSTTEFDGFYAAYISGMAGNGLVMLVFAKHLIVGVDTTGVCFDGHYVDSGSSIHADVTVTVPPNTELIQGTKAGDEGLTYQITMDLPRNFADIAFVPITTPLGKVNARFQRMRALGELV